jgi:plastocyanin
MRFTLAPAVLAVAAVASATTIQVNVGQNGLEYTPPSINASVGDTVEFIFHPKNHTVTQSTFAAPCQPMANGIDSDFRPVAANATQGPSMSIMVNSTDPVWFFCRQTEYVAICPPRLLFYFLFAYCRCL